MLISRKRVFNNRLFDRPVTIKSLQQVGLDLPPNTLTIDVTISEVDLSKAVIIFDGSCVQASSSIRYFAYLEFIDSTTVRVTRNTATSHYTELRFTVAELENVKSIQRGVMTLSSYNDEVTINEVDFGKSILLSLGFTTTSTDTRSIPYIYLKDGETVHATRYSPTTATAYVSYIVVEFY